MDVLNQPLVSIVCLTYNHEAYIRECLDGFVMQQTNFPIEIIVHDDASTDSTATIVKEYEEKYPHLFNNVYRTENWYSQGKDIWGYLFTQKAQGKYIALCEGDDYWTDPLKLQKQVDFLEKNPEYSFCCARFRKYKQEKDIFEKEYAFDYYLENQNLEITEKLFFKIWVTQPLTVLYQKDLYIEIQKYLKRYKYTRDVHLFYHLLKIGNGISLNRCVGIYRLHEGGIAGCRSNVERYKESVKIYWDLLKYNLGDIHLWRILSHCMFGYLYFKCNYKIYKS